MKQLSLSQIEILKFTKWTRNKIPMHFPPTQSSRKSTNLLVTTQIPIERLTALTIMWALKLFSENHGKPPELEFRDIRNERSNYKPIPIASSALVLIHWVSRKVKNRTCKKLMEIIMFQNARINWHSHELSVYLNMWIRHFFIMLTFNSL